MTERRPLRTRRYLPDGRLNPAWNPSGEDYKKRPGTMFWTEGDLAALWGDNRSEYMTVGELQPESDC